MNEEQAVDAGVGGGEVFSHKTIETKVIHKEITKRYDVGTAYKSAILDTEYYAKGGYTVNKESIHWTGFWLYITFVKEIREER